MRKAVLGAGYLGKRISESLGYSLVGRERINALNLKEIERFLDLEKPEVVINCIGKTGIKNIDWCEEKRIETIQGNIIAAANIGTACAEKEIYFVHMGSGCIYKGDNEGKGFSEEDKPNFYGPQFYAKTKILAESILKEIPSLQLRIRMPIDGKPHPRNLINKLLNYTKLIEIQNSMTTVPHAMDGIKKLIEKRKTGIYNFVNPGTISAFEIMEMYKELVDSNHAFGKMTLEELSSKTLAERSNCFLNTDKLRSEGIELPEIHDAVRECLIKFRKDSGK